MRQTTRMISACLSFALLVQKAPAPADLVPAPAMLSRAAWGAKPPLAYSGPVNQVRWVTIHHTGVRQNPNRTFVDKLRGLQAFSQREDKLANGRTKPQWVDIPYHYYIDVKGELAECRPISIPGDTNTTYNPAGHALVVIEGDFTQDVFHESQRQTMLNVVTWLCAQYRVAPSRIRGHRDWTPGETTCPGLPVEAEFPWLRATVTQRLVQAGLNPTAW